ncbi:MAG: hypothetical protein GY729_01740 [Desulfobacteraceae bacterium]|nr:hypothetical protein [Desulfobacteraceae bacterium]
MWANDTQENDPIFTIMLFFFTALAGGIFLIFLYNKNTGPINAWIIYIVQLHLKAFSYLPGAPGADADLLLRSLDQCSPKDFTFAQVMSQISFVGGYLRWMVMPFLAGLFLVLLFSKKCMSVTDYYKTRHTLKTLLKSQVKEFPCMAPVANRKKSLLDEPLDKGRWRAARHPVQFAAAHRLLTYKNLSIDNKHLIRQNGLVNEDSYLLKDNNHRHIRLCTSKTRELFALQLGRPFKGFQSLKNHHTGLAAAFMAFGCGKKDQAQQLLDQMSLSFKEPAAPASEFKMDITGAKKIINQYKNHPEFKTFTGKHQAFINVWMVSLLEFARQKGVLTCPQFIWLRPMDRSLWYALNQTGGQTAWVEAAGVFAHFQAEETLGRNIPFPQMETAIQGFSAILESAGWLPSTSQQGDVC